MPKLSVIADGISRDFAHAAKVASAAGLGYVELQYLSDTLVGDLAPRQIKDAKAVADSHGVRFSCLSHDLFGKLPVATTDIGDPVFEAHMSTLRRLISIAHDLETDLVRIMCFRKEMILFGRFGAEKTVVTTGAWDKFVHLMEPPVRLARQEGIRLVVETSNKGMVNSAYLGRKLVDAIGSSALKVLWDPANALYAGEPAFPDGYEMLAGGYLGHMHLKDLVATPATASVDCCALGDGQMAPYLEPIADGLRRDDYDGFVSLESVYCPENGTFEDGFHASIERFKSLFGQSTRSA